jgi:Na+/proline symporter
MAGVKIGIILFGVSATTVVIVTAVAGIIYAAFGGVRGVIYTDFYLFTVIMVGAVVAAFYALGQPEVGGMAGLVAKLEAKGTLDFFPKFTDMDTLMAVFIMPVAMHWWTVCKSGAEPGGGSYIVQRILTAKNENHAIGGMFFFSLAHHAFRPFPWYIVGLCSILVFPDITKAFPNVPANFQGGDVAYPAMLKLVPPGWYGVVAASMAGALLSKQNIEISDRAQMNFPSVALAVGYRENRLVLLEKSVFEGLAIAPSGTVERDSSAKLLDSTQALLPFCMDTRNVVFSRRRL